LSVPSGYALSGEVPGSPSDATPLEHTLDAASEPSAPPEDAALAADVARYAIEPLFVRGVSDTL
jgi:hypothetical protein